jgi:hypothetical protein
MSTLTSPDLVQLRAAEAAPLREKWGWMVAFGALLALAGLAALGSVVGSTIATVYFVGVAMIVGGLAEIAYAFAVRSWKKFFLWDLIGLLYVVGGAAVVRNPLLAPHARSWRGSCRLWIGANLPRISVAENCAMGLRGPIRRRHAIARRRHSCALAGIQPLGAWHFSRR